ncbi:hypothetical protein AG1IA_06788 [Rhizoctonia solani AG-1 IA]|uniref:Uncharacterized protein n=1 Tax=Thanatephorus cucumeris (strain AG1-IA) TaxID=983506 RepID=L8WQX5_THACA|nr:hypothetical protein AG1IA_06788 [Rhizoctonia solani AG-1 IA]
MNVDYAHNHPKNPIWFTAALPNTGNNLYMDGHFRPLKPQWPLQLWSFFGD